MTVLQEIEVCAARALQETASNALRCLWHGSVEWHTVLAQIEEDLHALAQRDPAARGDAAGVLRSYTSFDAVLHYRLAHQLLRHPPLGVLQSDAQQAAGQLFFRGKQRSGAELHPAATLGRRFVLDHGVGTVIGETAAVGDDCYVLGGVTLGAKGVGHNPFGPRHPVLGHRVQVGAHASVLGRVTIGDDVFIGSHCIVHYDVPAGHSVIVRQQHQVIRNPDRSLTSRLMPRPLRGSLLKLKARVLGKPPVHA